jgi:hypothetical protein
LNEKVKLDTIFMGGWGFVQFLYPNFSRLLLVKEKP